MSDATLASSDGSAGDDGQAGGDAPSSSDGSAGGEGQAGGDAPSSTDAPLSANEAGTGDSGASDTGAASDASSAGNVLQHHNDQARTGVYIDPAMTPAALATLHVDTAFTGTVTGDVYAQPLFVAQGPNNTAAFYLATQQNHVTALNATTGAVLWDKTFGTPKAGANADKPCGTIDSVGITGTPVIDLTSRTLYFDAMVSTDDNATLTHVTHDLFAVSIDTGATATGWPVNAGPLFTTAGTNAANQNQRGALALVGGVVYVAYGGHVGDCTPYRGTLIGVPVASPSTPTLWATGSFGSTGAGRGGIWAPGGVASDGTSVYVVTGNTSASDAVGASFTAAPAEWSGGEAVFRFASGPTFTNEAANSYYPTNWATLDSSDTDLGGSGPIVFDMPSAPVPHLIAAFGKDGYLYLLDRDSLGVAGGGGELAKVKVANGVITGAQVEYTTRQGTYLAMRGSGVGCA